MSETTSVPPEAPSAEAPPPSPGADRPEGGGRWDAIVRAIEWPFDHVLAHYKLSLFAGLLVAGAAFWLSYALTDHQSALLGRLAEAKVAQLRSEMSEAIATRERALGDLAQEWDRRPPDTAAWSRDAALLIQRDLQFRAIAWLDDTLGTRWMRPTTAGLVMAPLDAIDEPIRRHAIEALDPALPVTVTRSYIRVDGSRQIMVRAFLHRPDGVRETLIGVIRPVDLFDAVVGPEIKQGWAISVYEGPYLMFGPQWIMGGAETEWTREAEAVVGGLGVTLRLWPSEELAAVLRSRLPQVTLLAGLALALLVALGTRWIQTSSRRRA